jgi:hypothetical protein
MHRLWRELVASRQHADELRTECFYVLASCRIIGVGLGSLGFVDTFELRCDSTKQQRDNVLLGAQSKTEVTQECAQQH